jgi:hypothetical protein
MTSPGTGGLPGRRLDQIYSPPASASQAGSSAGIFRGRLVVISGSGANGSTGLFVYTGAPAAGNLLLSVAAVAGTDPYGNAYEPGLQIFGTGDVGQSIQMGVGASGTAELSMPTGSGFELVPANLFTGVSGTGLTKDMQSGLSGPQANVAGAEDWVQIIMGSNNAGGTGPAVGELVYVNNAQVGSLRLSWGSQGVSIGTLTSPVFLANGTSGGAFSAGAEVFATSAHLLYEAGDGNSYDTGRLTNVMTSTLSTTGTAFIPVPALTAQCGIGTYKFRLWGTYTGTAPLGTGAFIIGAPANTLSLTTCRFTAANTFTFTKGLVGTSFITPALTTTSQMVELEGMVTTTAASTLTVQIAEITNGDVMNLQAGTCFEVFPVI